MTAKPRQFDVVICGAGPAGSTCAMALINSGLSVALIDKDVFPRNKVCGDAVAAYAGKVLKSIHSDFEIAFKKFEKRYPVNTYRIFGPRGNYVDVTSHEYGMIAKRVDWDHFLFELAASQSHVTCLMDTAAQDILVDQSRHIVSVTTNREVIETKLVIGCDGAHSIVSKKLAGRSMDPHHHSAAVRAYFSNVSGIASQTFELHFIKDILPGYFWIFPLPNNEANVGLGALSYNISTNRINLREAFKKIIYEHPLVSQRFSNARLIGEVQGFGLPLGSKKRPMSGDHFMLCGDAASLIDPLTGEGIGPAMVSGRYAGWQAIKCFEQNDFSRSFLKQYDRQVNRKFWNHYKKSYLIQKHVMNKPWLINGLISSSNKSRMIHKILTRLVT